MLPIPRVFALVGFVTLLVGVASSPAQAQTFANASQSKVNYTKTPFQAQLRCSDLVALSNYDYSIISARLILSANNPANPVPDHCRISAVVPSEVRFELNLPLRWNGRLYMYGNGGLAGTPASAPNRQYTRDLALQNGFATVYTDTGHDKRVHAGGSFAYRNLHKLVDYGFRAVHLSVMTAKQLTQTFYAQAVKHSYFNGCSTGGRQGLLAAQRFPSDFDGIIAGAPAADYSGLKFSQAWRVSAIANSGLTEAEVLVLADHIYQACDIKDGLADGLIADPRRCDFDVERDLPKCLGADTDDCFDDTERAALEKYYAPVKLAGEEIYPAMPVGSEVLGESYDGQLRSGWYPWLINDNGPVLLDLLGSDFFRYMAFVVDRPEFDWTTFDFAQRPDNLDEFSDIVDAVNPDLSAFAEAGGKLLTYFGWADPDINPLTLLAYREQVAAQDAKLDNYFRTFMMPGMFHCRGGAGPDRFDAMTPLIEWVEQGSAPDTLATWKLDRNGQRISRRPSCPFPQEATPQSDGRFICSVPSAQN